MPVGESHPILVKSISTTSSLLRAAAVLAEAFSLTNHPNFALPVNDLASPSFGRILEAGPARLIQFGLKLIF
jgi:hypothetical protein